MPLLDQYGNPLQKEVLTQEQATATVSGVRNILGEYQTAGLTPERLASLLRQADEGDASAYLSMAEEIEEKDTHYASVIGTRKRAVSQLDITVVPASDEEIDIKAAKLIEDWISRDQLENELFHILDAIGKGFSSTEIIWDISEKQWMPKDLRWRDPRWFEFSRADGTTLMLKETGGAVPLHPYKFIIHTAQSKSGLTIRGGIARPCAWMWLFKNFSIKDWVIFLEAYGQPIRLGKYNPGASKEDRQTLMKAVANIGSDAAAIIPSSMQLEFIEAQGKTGTADVFKDLCNFADQQISKAVLGQTTTTDSIGGGGLAGNQSHNDVRGDIERSDAKQLAATLNQQLIKPIIDLNMGPQKRYPRLQIGRSDDVDIAKLSAAAKTFQSMGGEVSKSKLRSLLALPAPTDDEDILVAPQKEASAEETDTASQRPKKELASEEPDATPSSFDQAVDEMAGDYEEVIKPTMDVVQSLLNECENFDQFVVKLLTLPGTLPVEELASKLDRASVNARLAGNAEAKIE